MPHYFRTALEYGAQFKYPSDNALGYGVRTRLGDTLQGWNTPSTPVEVIHSTVYPVWSVRIVHLDIPVQDVPFLFPTVDGAAVHAASVRNYLQG